VLHLTLDGPQHGPLATLLQDTRLFDIPLGHQTPMAANRPTPLLLLITMVLHTAHRLPINMATRLPDILQPERPLILAHNLSRQV